MKIGSNSTNFRARNLEIRFADDIARRINNAYPTISPSKISGRIEKQDKPFCDLYNKLWSKMSDFRSNSKYQGVGQKSLEKILLFFEGLQNEKIANCGEMTDATLVAAKLNKIKDFTKAGLATTDGRDLDHAVVYVKNGKKPYIIDSWLGFADYVEGAKQRYFNEYGYHFDLDTIEKPSDLEFTLNDYSRMKLMLDQDMPDEHLDILKDELSTLMVKNRKINP